MHKNRIFFSRALFIIILLFGKLLVSVNNVKAVGITIRPPFDGQYRLTSFFDHNYPNYGHDNEITIYTGESVANCSPHCYQGHSGYDWALTEGTPIYAVSDGIVEDTIINLTEGYGNRLIIMHSNGYRSLYAHLREINPFNVSEGDNISAGDLIGWSGNTGNTSGAHLHLDFIVVR